MSGALVLTLDNKSVLLSPGDSFYVSDLKEEVFLTAEAQSELLYITNGSLFSMLSDYQGDLKKLLLDINDKDHITFAHSRRVQRYAIALFRNLPQTQKRISADEMIIAALFHDVGKCFVPDEVLKKPGKLTPEEWRHIIKHPTNSARLLRPRFGEKVAEIAQNHHERLDGSGYPFGLRGDDISREAKIIAIADVFDAMTTARGYNQVKGFEEAAAELVAAPDKFDGRIAGVLMELVNDGLIQNELREDSPATEVATHD